MTYRNRKYLDLAHRVTECQVQIPGICEGYTPDGCEPAHSNHQAHGKGIGHKAHDIYHAASCHSCHAEIDNGTALSREAKTHYWQAGFERTLLHYFHMGWLKVV